MWELDSFNGLTFTLVALALNYIVQRKRIASFLLFNKYKKNQRELRVQANFDYLSGVIFRSIFMDLSQKAIEQPECTDFFIGLVDIDYFKQINDNYGRFLPATARRKRLALRKCRACRRLLPRRRSH
ncbi:diguanylate cyclase domain-containing protein [Lactobacillus delbrueckii subsp. bulgaricus]